MRTKVPQLQPLRHSRLAITRRLADTQNMAHPEQKKTAPFTWNDYRTWPNDQKWEIIDGVAFAMSPSPTSRHQSIVGDLHGHLYPQFKRAPCKLIVSPMDVHLTDLDVVQPDLLVVCKPEQIQRTHIEGAPSLVIEVVSGDSLTRDRVRKLHLYARCGVQEYWIVTPYPSVVEVLQLDHGSYRLHGGYMKEDTLLSPLFPELRLELSDVFRFPLEPGDELPIMREPPAHCYETAAPAT